MGRTYMVCSYRVRKAGAPRRTGALPTDALASLLTPHDVAQLLGVSVSTLANWRTSRPRGPRWLRLGQPGSPVRYPRAEVDAWLQARGLSAASPPGSAARQAKGHRVETAEKVAWVRDNWHTELSTAPPCRECSRGRTRLRKAAEHGKGKRWEVRYYDWDKVQRRGGRYATEHEAETKAAEIRRRYARGPQVADDVSRTQITVSAWISIWWGLQTADESSLRSYRCRIAHIERLIGKRPLDSLRPITIQEELVTPLAQELAPSYVRQIMSTLRNALDMAVADERMASNPARSKLVKTPSLDKAPVEVWPDRHVPAVGLALPLWCTAMVPVAGWAGLRQGEVFGLSVDDIDEERGLVHVRRQVKRHGTTLVYALPKGRRVRTVPLMPALARTLRMHLEVIGARPVSLPWVKPDGQPQTHRLFFTDPETAGGPGGPVRRSWFNESTWKPALAAAGVIRAPEFYRDWEESSGSGMHALRHWYAATQLELGVNPYALSLYLGHSTPGFTLSTYGHLTDRAGKRTAEDHAAELADLSERLWRVGRLGVRCEAPVVDSPLREGAAA